VNRPKKYQPKSLPGGASSAEEVRLLRSLVEDLGRRVVAVEGRLREAVARIEAASAALRGEALAPVPEGQGTYRRHALHENPKWEGVYRDTTMRTGLGRIHGMVERLCHGIEELDDGVPQAVVRNALNEAFARRLGYDDLDALRGGTGTENTVNAFAVLITARQEILTQFQEFAQAFCVAVAAKLKVAYKPWREWPVPDAAAQAEILKDKAVKYLVGYVLEGPWNDGDEEEAQ
jgi:hypothetical protein